MSKLIIVAGLAGLAVLAGILVATQVNLNPAQGPISEISAGIHEITFGIQQDGGSLKTRNYYYTNEQLALRVSRQQLSQSVSLNGRLLNQDQFIIPLSPSHITIPANTTTFCCFAEMPEGDYTLQLFRPDGKTTNIPITIRPARNQGGGGFNTGV